MLYVSNLALSHRCKLWKKIKDHIRILQIDAKNIKNFGDRKMDNEAREEVKTLLTKAIVNLDWKEDETATEYIKDAYNKMIYKYIIVSLNYVLIKNDKVKLSKTIYLTVQFENGQFIVSYNDLGLLTVSDSLDSAIENIQIQFSGLWEDYVTSPEEELARSGIFFKNKLMGYVDNV